MFKFFDTVLCNNRHSGCNRAETLNPGRYQNLLDSAEKLHFMTGFFRNDEKILNSLINYNKQT